MRQWSLSSRLDVPAGGKDYQLNSRLPVRARAAAVVSTVLILLLQLPLGSVGIQPVNAATAGQLRRAPYLTDLGATTVTVNWATDTSQTIGSMTYGVAPNCSTSTQSATRTSITVGTVAEYQWTANISGLSADTSYCYRVYFGTTDLLGTDTAPTFKSQVAAGSGTPFSFAVFGDWGQVDSTGSNPDQANLMRQIAASGVRFAITTGDTGYPGGSQLTYGDLQQKGADTSAIYGPAFWSLPGRSVPLFNTSGNHGFDRAWGLTNWPQARTVAGSSGRYQMDTYCCTNGTASASYPSAWYAFDAGNTRFYVLSAAWAELNVGTADAYKNDYDNHWTASSPEYQWLKNDLETHPTALKFAFWHYPLYSDNATETSSTYLQGTNSLEGLLASHGVDIGFNGHAHMYQRNRQPAGGIITYLTGGGGAKVEPIGGKGCSALDAYGIGWSYTSSTGSRCGAAVKPTSLSQVFHFLKVSVSGTSVTVTPTDSLGRTFDVQTYNFSTVADTQPPTAPSALTATASSANQVNLSWTAATDNVGVTAHDVYRDGALLASIGNVTSYTDSSVSATTTYTYAVKARDAAGNASPASNGATVTTPAPPPTLTFSATDDTYVQQASPTTTAGSATTLQVDNSPVKQILIKFNVSGLSGKQVTSAKLRLYDSDPSPAGGDFYQTADSSWTQATANWNNAPSTVGNRVASLGSVTASTWYEVDLSSIVTGDGVISLRVTSNSSNGANYTSSNGTAAFRPQLVVTYDASTPTPPPAPTGLSATSGNAQVSLSWTASSGATSYNVRRSTTNGGPYTTVSTPGAVTTTSYTDSGLTNATTYYYVVTAVNSAGESGNSNEASAQPAAAPTKPDPPTGLSASAASGDKPVSLTWTAPAGTVDSYTVKRSTTTGTGYSSIGSTSTTSFSDTTAIAGQTYYYVITASNTGGESGNSNEATATLRPAAPTGLSANPGNAQVTLSWTGSSGAASSTVKRSTTNGGPYSTVASGVIGTTYLDTGLTNGATYYYVVSATNTGGTSGDSTQASATPQAATRTFIFSDGFETGNMSKWTSSGGLTLESTQTHTGTWAAQGNTTNGATYAKKTLSTTYTDGYFRIYFYLAPGYTSQVNVLRYRTAADGSLGYLFVTTAGKLALRNDVGAVTTTSATSVASGAWHALELHLTTNGSASSTEVWLDDTRVTDLSLTGQNWGTTPIGRIQIGEVQTGRTYNVTFDDVAFDPARVGLTP